MRVLIIAFIFFGLFSQSAWANPKWFSASVKPGIVEFQMIDPLGNVTGYDPTPDSSIGSVLTKQQIRNQLLYPTTGKKIQNIPNTIYHVQTLPGVKPDGNPYSSLAEVPENDILHSIEPQSSEVLEKNTIPSGTYKLKVFGTIALKTFTFYMDVAYSFPIVAHGEKISIIYPNVIWTYEVAVPALPPANNQLTVVKVAAPTDLVTDITAASKLGLIGNAEFVNELIKRIQDWEKEKTEAQKPEEQKQRRDDHGLVERYKELLKEITEKYNKPEKDEFVKQEAYTVLKEDIEYIIGHIK